MLRDVFRFQSRISNRKHKFHENSVPEEFADKMTSLETKWNAKRAKAEGRPMVPYCK